jgi:hypothetical protein
LDRRPTYFKNFANTFVRTTQKDHESISKQLQFLGNVGVAR